MSEKLVHLDASTFQEPLWRLAEVLAQKVKREAPKLIGPPAYVATDLHVLIRQAMFTYNLLFYLNADERRNNDCFWHIQYSIVTLPLIRNMIDCLYNITAILQNPRVNGARFRKSGYKKMFAAFDEDERRYGGQAKWDTWIAKNRSGLDFDMRAAGITAAQVAAAKPWPTLGKYASDKQRGAVTTPHQDFLKTFLLGQWREYSAMAHGAFEGLIPVAMFYIKDSMPHEYRPRMEEFHGQVLFMHIGRAAGVLLCIVTELQAYFRFDDDGARINQRIHAMWNALMPAFEIRELYDKRYAQLMKDRHIDP